VSELQYFTVPGEQLWVSPTHQKTTVGGLETFAQFQTGSPASRPGVPYAYSVELSGPAGLIPSGHFRVPPSSLATIDNRYFQDFASVGGWGITGGNRNDDGVETSGGSFPLRLPGHLIEYVTASPDVVWSQTYFQFVDVTPGLPTAAGGQSDGFRSFRPGQHVTENWNAFPLHPQPVTFQARFSDP